MRSDLIRLGVLAVVTVFVFPSSTVAQTTTSNPVPFVDIVVETLAGTRINKNGQRASASQIQSGWTLRF